MAAWIQFRIPNVDPDPEGLKRAEVRKKSDQKKIIRHKKVYTEM
jgi:hypothetical protein